MAQAMAHQPGVTGWSEFGFGQLMIDHQEVPVLGVLPELGSVQPPTTSGHALANADQIELGTVTMRQLGVHVGDRVLVGHRESMHGLFTVVGTVTLPSMGTVLTDHVSLGRGAMMDEDCACWRSRAFALSPKPSSRNSSATDSALSSPSYPSVVAIDATSSCCRAPRSGQHPPC